MNKPLTFSLLLGCLLGIAPALRAQVTPTIPPPVTPARPEILQSNHTVTLDLDTSRRKASKPAPAVKPRQSNEPKKPSRPRPTTGSTTGNKK